MKKSTPYTHWRIIPFGDTDAAAIVYTPNFSNYCMEAAECWFRDYIGIDWYRANVELGLGTPVVHMEMDMVSPLFAGDKLGISIEVIKIGRSTIALGFQAIRHFRNQEQQQKLSFTAQFIFCFTSKKVGGAISVPDEQRKRAEEYRAQGDMS